MGALLVKPALKGLKNELDYEQYGGAALLGVTGAVVKAHGSSKAHAYACAIRQARTMVEGKVVDIIAGARQRGRGRCGEIDSTETERRRRACLKRSRQ